MIRDRSQIGSHLESQMQSMITLMTSIGFLMGTVMFMMGLFMIYKDSKQPDQDYLKKGIMSLLVGVMMLSLPGMMKANQEAAGWENVVAPIPVEAERVKSARDYEIQIGATQSVESPVTEGGWESAGEVFARLNQQKEVVSEPVVAKVVEASGVVETALEKTPEIAVEFSDPLSLLKILFPVAIPSILLTLFLEAKNATSVSSSISSNRREVEELKEAAIAVKETIELVAEAVRVPEPVAATVAPVRTEAPKAEVKTPVKERTSLYNKYKIDKELNDGFDLEIDFDD